MKRFGTERGKKKHLWAKITKWYGYQNRVVPVPPYKMCMVSVPNRVVPVPHCPDSYNFV